MKAYITRYALTSGVFVFEGEKTIYADGIIGKRSKRSPYEVFYFGKDVHFSKESALKRCEEMKARKLKSLMASIKKIEAMEFVFDEELDNN